jgi:hypothetical protein
VTHFANGRHLAAARTMAGLTQVQLAQLNSATATDNCAVNSAGRPHSSFKIIHSLVKVV